MVCRCRIFRKTYGKLPAPDAVCLSTGNVSHLLKLSFRFAIFWAGVSGLASLKLEAKSRPSLSFLVALCQSGYPHAAVQELIAIISAVNYASKQCGPNYFGRFLCEKTSVFCSFTVINRIGRKARLSDLKFKLEFALKTNTV